MVQGVYKFTPFGLYTLCRRLSPNLGSVISDLSGVTKRPTEDLRTDVRAAVLVLNTIIKLRFSGALEGYRMIVDPLRRTIDGIVGSRYEYVSNISLLERANQFVGEQG